jgi:hypothetical protein
MRVRGVVKSLLCSLSYLFRDPAFLATVHIRVRGVVIEGVWGRKRRGQPHILQHPLSGYSIAIARQIRSINLKKEGLSLRMREQS